MATKKKTTGKIKLAAKGAAAATLEAAKSRADQLKKLIKAHKKELRGIRGEIKAAKKAARSRSTASCW